MVQAKRGKTDPMHHKRRETRFIGLHCCLRQRLEGNPANIRWEMAVLPPERIDLILSYCRMQWDKLPNWVGPGTGKCLTCIWRIVVLVITSFCWTRFKNSSQHEWGKPRVPCWIWRTLLKDKITVSGLMLS